MKAEAELRFVYTTSLEAAAIAKALSPDNYHVPAGLSVKTVSSGRQLSASVHCEKPLETLIATLDDLLACVSAAESAFKTIQAINQGRKRSDSHPVLGSTH